MSKQNILIVIDMQNDFIDGSLGSDLAKKIINRVVDKINSWDGPILLTKDTHHEEYLDTQEGKNLPIKHCVKDTEGWMLNIDVKEAIDKKKDYKTFYKNTFGSIELAQYIKDNEKDIESVTLIGLCTGICVISNAMLIKAFCPELKIIVDGKCSACISKESHLNALSAMKLCQIEIIR